MRTDREIRNKIELLTSRDWPEAKVARGLLDEYLSGVRSSRPDDLILDLKVECLKSMEGLLDRDSAGAQFSLIRAESIIWMLEDYALLRAIVKLKHDDSYIENRLGLIDEQYHFMAQEGQSEEE